ncbi:hypothetical protein MFRU_030g01050 [Monilinia fructicola]|nr:hypothetical protein MFRU_030g01050 [Monilinia fructicola]
MNTPIDNEYVLSAEYLQEEAYHGSSISHKFAQILLWTFVSILITPILLILSFFHSSDNFWVAATVVIFAIVLIISYFRKDDKNAEDEYTTAWEVKTRSVQQIIQDRIYPQDRNTKFRTSHLAKVSNLQTIPENQHPQSMSKMRPEMSEKYTAAMTDMTSETRVMLNIHLLISGAISMVLVWAAYYYHHNPHSIDEAANYMLVVGKVVVVLIMYMSVLHQTKFWIEELERERRGILRGWDIFN